MPPIAQLQLGKNGLTDKFISTLENHFKKHKNVKVSVLRSATRDKKEIKKFSQVILSKLGNKYTARVVGFTIILKKWRKER